MGLIQDRIRLHIDGLVQGKRYSIANALDLRLPCTKPFFVFSLSITWRNTVISQ